MTGNQYCQSKAKKTTIKKANLYYINFTPGEIGSPLIKNNQKSWHKTQLY